MGQTMERLSTGSRINSAADDAAGLAISSKLTSQVRGLDQAQRNANDAISMIQTADGAAIEIDNMLQRMREVSVQAANGTNTTSDIANLDIEFAALADEIDRIVNATEWNGMSILDGTSGTAGSFNFQIGANDAQTLAVDFSDFNLTAGSTATAERAAVSAVKGVQVIDLKAAVSDGVNYNVGDTFNIGGTEITLKTLDTGKVTVTTIAKDIGDALDGFTAAASNNTVEITQVVGAAFADPMTVTFNGTGSTPGTVSTSLKTVGVAAVAKVDAVADSKPMSSNLSGALSANATITSTTANIVTTLDKAIAGVASQRATFGAAINRLEYTVDNLANVSQNTSASRSRIQDADYAAETTELARTQIIQQAGTAMLSQANQQAQSVLALLK
ncbi:flagellar protein [marine gamma proteobacterium HTCC2207]|uniref:Flagellin n=1 Tax=gamma proteobacterium HTCC2207 TaxID=314287 RepID=Q1YVA6_9GAMM|nr:flagellar protein [marine gamma proteobacterium HTCC2207] [gamma proteobacterium HTCC2207]